MRYAYPADKRNPARRAQILTAAADCFRAHGFNGASVARISDIAGTSTGNIYNYFDNKESIVSAIVARELDRTLAFIAELRPMNDILDAILERMARIIESRLAPDNIALNLEIIAEASRNPTVAQIVRQADEQARASIASLLRDACPDSASKDDESDLAAMIETLLLILDGLMIRCIRNPDLDPEFVVDLACDVMRTLSTVGAHPRIPNRAR